jgi:NAD(P)-dependent dehydrogenase (short-subunit alcohol dehydrogenase family)
VNPDGVVAVVSGGSSGLGRATVEALAAAGARVVILDLADPGEWMPAGADFRMVDVRSPVAMAEAIDHAAGLGDLRVAVACAGVGTAGRVLRKGAPLDLDHFRHTIDINLVGTFNLVRLAAAKMSSNAPVDGERGVMIATASIAAFDGQIGQVAYSASKAGVAGMILPLARDLAENEIRCCAIAPGLFDTPLLAALPENAKRTLEQTVPHPARLGLPEEYAALALQVVQNQMLNGETIRLDGALRMAPR